MDACHLIYEYHFLKTILLHYRRAVLRSFPSFLNVFLFNGMSRWENDVPAINGMPHIMHWVDDHRVEAHWPTKRLKWNQIFQTRFPLFVFFISMSTWYKDDCWINEFHQENRFAGEQPTTTPSQSILHSTGKCNRTFKNCKTTLPGATGQRGNGNIYILTYLGPVTMPIDHPVE